MLILLVEDEERIAAFVSKGLEAEGYSCVRARDTGEAIALALSEQIDLVVLDLVLPDGSGLDVLTALRRFKAGLPVLILTALDDVSSRVRGLNAGADDLSGSKITSHLEQSLINRHDLGRLGVISYRGAQEAIGPLLGELARAGKDHWDLGVADGQPTQHVRQPGSTAGLSSKEVRVVTFDHNRRLRELGQALQLEGEAAVGE